MKTPFKDGVIAVKLAKPEVARMAKAHEIVKTLANMHPIRQEISDAAQAADAAIGNFLALVGQEFLPLVDGQAKPSEPAEPPIIPPDAPAPPTEPAAPPADLPPLGDAPPVSEPPTEPETNGGRKRGRK